MPIKQPNQTHTHIPVIVLFNSKGRVRQTSLVYHAAWMFSDLEKKVIVADLDPQANLTAAFLTEDRLEELWTGQKERNTIFGSILPLKKGTGDIADPYLEEINETLYLLPGDLALTEFEDSLSEVWPKCSDGEERAFRITAAFWRILQRAADMKQADMILVDIGPNLGAINRSVLISTDYIVVPLAPDLYSIQGLQNLGPAIKDWREKWQERLEKNPDHELMLPDGQMEPIGYIVMQHAERLNRPVLSYQKWVSRIPNTYWKHVIRQPGEERKVEDDPNCIALVKDYKSLIPLSQEAGKPIFHLKPADGALGAHYNAAQQSRKVFESMVKRIAELAGIELS